MFTNCSPPIFMLCWASFFCFKLKHMSLNMIWKNMQYSTNWYILFTNCGSPTFMLSWFVCFCLHWKILNLRGKGSMQYFTNWYILFTNCGPPTFMLRWSVCFCLHWKILGWRGEGGVCNILPTDIYCLPTAAPLLLCWVGASVFVYIGRY